MMMILPLYLQYLGISISFVFTDTRSSIFPEKLIDINQPIFQKLVMHIILNDRKSFTDMHAIFIL